MNTGERQVAETVAGIRRDHVARYEWAAKQLTGQVYDLGCGIGYGSRILAESGCEVVAIDRSNDALDYGLTHYGHDRVQMQRGDLGDASVSFDPADAAVCFEVIEHLKDPRPLLKALTKSVKRLLVSVPNEEVLPWNNTAFHQRHYTPEQFGDLLIECGWRVVDRFGQAGPESEVAQGVNGRTLIAVCVPETGAVKSAPKRVAIVGLGPSKEEFFSLMAAAGGKRKMFDEIWVINALGDIVDCDLVWHMDDVKIQEIRAAAKPDGNIAEMVKWLKTTTKPVMTSRAYPDYPALRELPLEELVNDLTFDYFNNTAAWAMAYAIHIGVEKIGLYGCDYTYPNSHDAEKGRGCLEFWLGYAAARGMKITLPLSTTLMDACYPRQDRLYGFDTRRAKFSRDDSGRLRVSFEEVEKLPTAEEIEHRYDHTRHPNALVEAKQEG